jgi:hypothetical protein
MLSVVFNKRMRWVEYVAFKAEKINTYKILAGKPEGKEPFGKPRLGSDDSTKMDHNDIG